MIQAMIPKPLTKESFSKFGDVIEVSDKSQHFTINHGFTERYHDLAKIDVNAHSGHPLLSIFRSSPIKAPIILESMERHPLSSQAFFPLSEHAYLVVVAPAGEFDYNAIEVFLAQSNQGVNYHRGTWHHYCLALHGSSDFLVLDRGTRSDAEDKNCDVVVFDENINISLDQ